MPATSANPLNRALYRRLQSLFGEVKIANEGIPFEAKPVRDPRRKGKIRFSETGEFGEYYQVCCPCCSDGRFRCWINHRWGTEIAGVSTKYLAVCYNEHCEDGGKLNNWLERHMATYIGRKFRVSKPVRRDDDEEHRRILIPEHMCRLDELDDDHVVLDYLEHTRKFDLTELARVWDVRWVKADPDLPPHHRILFPVYELREGQVHMAGFQTRFFNAGTGSGKASEEDLKWFTPSGMRKAQLLYNGYRVRSKLVVGAEGPFDVIRIGQDHGVGFFGKGISGRQRRMLWNNWGALGGVMILALDPDAWDQASKEYMSFIRIENEMMRAYENYARLELPDGKDPGDTPRPVLWDLIARHLDAMGRYKEFKDDIRKAAQA